MQQLQQVSEGLEKGIKEINIVHWSIGPVHCTLEHVLLTCSNLNLRNQSTVTRQRTEYGV
jgi:hypothetical protein